MVALNVKYSIHFSLLNENRLCFQSQVVNRKGHDVAADWWSFGVLMVRIFYKNIIYFSFKNNHFNSIKIHKPLVSLFLISLKC